MSQKITKPVMNLKQFMVRQQVLKLYRDIFRAVRQVPDVDSKHYLQDWARTEFKKNKTVNDDYAIKVLMFNAERSLKELQQSLAFSR